MLAVQIILILHFAALERANLVAYLLRRQLEEVLPVSGHRLKVNCHKLNKI